MSTESDIDFLRKLQRLLAEGRFVATYKFALLQAIADLAVEMEAEPDGSLRVPVPAIAEKIIEYYWRQALPYTALPSDIGPSASARTLVQNTGKQAAIISHIVEARSRYDGHLSAARLDDRGFKSLRRKIAAVIRGMPLWRLQTIEGRPSEFLYRKVDDAALRDSIRLLPGIPKAMRDFHGLVTNLVRGAWLEQLQRIPANREILGKSSNLQEFLFGASRTSLEAYREILRQHQSQRCFYCGRRVKETGDVDHFIAWSRYPVDLGHNFVFAHPTCNRQKRDYLAHSAHLQRWKEQNLDEGASLAVRFNDAHLDQDVGRSRQIAWWAYQQGELSAAHVWLRKKVLEPIGDE